MVSGCAAWFIPIADERGVCACLESVPYLSALEVRSRRGAIQIQVYLTLPSVCFTAFSIAHCTDSKDLPVWSLTELENKFLGFRLDGTVATA